MDFTYLRAILDDLRSRFENKFAANSFQLRRELLALGDVEKQLIRKKILETDFNVGALSVLQILKETGILNVIAYLQSRNEDEAEEIITEIFDSEASLELLVEIILQDKTAEISSRFNKCFEMYVNDVLSRPELIKNEIITRIRNHLPKEAYEYLLSRFICELFTSKPQNEVQLTQIISNQQGWNYQYKQKQFELVLKILEEIAMKHSEVLVKAILEKLHITVDANWFILLLLISQVDHRSAGIEELKRFLKVSFKKFTATTDVELLHVVTIIARQLYHYNVRSTTTYKSWVETTIGSLYYLIKEPAQFTRAIEAVGGLICYENDREILETHLITPLSSVRGTNNLVLEYKQQLRTRIASLLPINEEVLMDLT